MADVQIRFHTLKSWPVYYTAIRNGRRKFDVRTNDRQYRVGDMLILTEYDPDAKTYTGRVTAAQVSYILKDSCAAVPSFGNVVILSLDNVSNLR